MTIMQWFYWTVASLGNLLGAIAWYGFDFPYLIFITLVYSLIGGYDLFFSNHSLNRLYPVVAYLRYFLESYRVEIQQYFIANDTQEQPFNREQRSLVYQRAKNVRDTIAFGTQQDLMQKNYLSLWHSLSPKKVKEEHKLVSIGGPDCEQPYQASYLNISAMSFGALSKNAIEALNLGAKKAGCFHNTGEGAVSPYHLKHGGDVVWQIGTALFGARHVDGRFNEQAFSQMAANDAIKMIEIKLSQGAKPAHGGVLPKAKITEEIAQIRQIAIDQDCISPAVNPYCKSPKELLQFVRQLRDLSGKKPVGFKLCIGNPAEFLAICKAMLELQIYPDFITVDGSEGGTGAAPLEFSNRLGLTCLEATYFVHNALTGVGLRDKIKIISAGKTASSFDVLAKVAVGADVVNAARTMMFALGCVQSKHCNTNHCPTGIATQNPARSKALDILDKSERVSNYHRRTMKSFFELVGSMGLDDPRQLVPSMIKRRSPYGLLMSFDSIAKPIGEKELLNNENLPEPWADWWHACSSDQFYVNDLQTLNSGEFRV